MWKLLAAISKNLIIAIPIMMVAGFLYGAGSGTGNAWLKQLIIPFTFLMVYPMMVTLKLKKRAPTPKFPVRVTLAGW